MTILQLKTLHKERGLDGQGKKSDLIQKLLAEENKEDEITKSNDAESENFVVIDEAEDEIETSTNEEKKATIVDGNKTEVKTENGDDEEDTEAAEGIDLQVKMEIPDENESIIEVEKEPQDMDTEPSKQVADSSGAKLSPKKKESEKKAQGEKPGKKEDEKQEEKKEPAMSAEELALKKKYETFGQIPDKQKMQKEMNEVKVRHNLAAFPIEMADMNHPKMVAALARCKTFGVRFHRLEEGNKEKKDFIGFLQIGFKRMVDLLTTMGEFKNMREGLQVSQMGGSAGNAGQFLARWNKMIQTCESSVDKAEKLDRALYIHKPPREVNEDKLSETFPEAEECMVVEAAGSFARHAYVIFRSKEQVAEILEEFKPEGSYKGLKLDAVSYAAYLKYQEKVASSKQAKKAEVSKPVAAKSSQNPVQQQTGRKSASQVRQNRSNPRTMGAPRKAIPGRGKERPQAGKPKEGETKSSPASKPKPKSAEASTAKEKETAAGKTGGQDSSQKSQSAKTADKAPHSSSKTDRPSASRGSSKAVETRPGRSPASRGRGDRGRGRSDRSFPERKGPSHGQAARLVARSRGVAGRGGSRFQSQIQRRSMQGRRQLGQRSGGHNMQQHAPGNTGPGLLPLPLPAALQQLQTTANANAGMVPDIQEGLNQVAARIRDTLIHGGLAGNQAMVQSGGLAARALDQGRERMDRRRSISPRARIDDRTRHEVSYRDRHDLSPHRESGRLSHGHREDRYHDNYARGVQEREDSYRQHDRFAERSDNRSLGDGLLDNPYAPRGEARHSLRRDDRDYGSHGDRYNEREIQRDLAAREYRSDSADYGHQRQLDQRTTLRSTGQEYSENSRGSSAHGDRRLDSYGQESYGLQQQALSRGSDVRGLGMAGGDVYQGRAQQEGDRRQVVAGVLSGGGSGILQGSTSILGESPYGGGYGGSPHAGGKRKVESLLIDEPHAKRWAQSSRGNFY